jgi:hypothetical protein
MDTSSYKTNNLRLFSTSKEQQEAQEAGGPNIFEKIASTFSTTAASNIARKYKKDFNPTGRIGMQILTLVRVRVPALLSGVVAFFSFPAMSLFLCSLFNDAGVFAVLSQDSSQLVCCFRFWSVKPIISCTNNKKWCIMPCSMK